MDPMRDLALDDQGQEILNAQKLFARYGYLTRSNGRYDEEMALHVVTAFQRHFRPQKIDGRLDHSTIDTLKKLIDTLPEVA